jgi:hypothetical protein
MRHVGFCLYILTCRNKVVEEKKEKVEEKEQEEDNKKKKEIVVVGLPEILISEEATSSQVCYTYCR